MNLLLIRNGPVIFEDNPDSPGDSPRLIRCDPVIFRNIRDGPMNIQNTQFSPVTLTGLGFLTIVRLSTPFRKVTVVMYANTVSQTINIRVIKHCVSCFDLFPSSHPRPNMRGVCETERQLGFRTSDNTKQSYLPIKVRTLG